MARISSSRLTAKERSALRRELMNAVRLLKKDDVWRFLSDLLTPGEVIMLARRICVARALLSGNTYDEVAVAQGASKSTVQHVDKAIQRGLRGYRTVVSRLRREERRRPLRPKPLNETAMMLRTLPGAGRFDFWIRLLAGEEKEK